MRWIRVYVKRHRLGICMYSLFCVIFATVLFLYRMPMEPMVYAVSLCLTLAVIVLITDSVRYRKKVEILTWQLEAVKEGTEKLPGPEDEIEQLYQMLLKNAQIEHARQVGNILQEKSEMTDYFTLWTHQIKTPIAAMHLLLQQEIRLQAQEITVQEENKAQEQYYMQKQEIESELFKIEQYVEMVLQYLRLNSSVNDFVLQEYELDGIIRQAVRKYAPMFIRRKLSLHYEPLQVKAVTDEKWMTFVLEQILSNAIKYTSSGDISIRMENGCLVIEDTGIGILPEDLPRIFDKGYTGYNGRSDKKASGIGLYLVKKILNKLGHKILIESEPGKGTKVKLLF
ncbi:HAMP domain-containing histidine kinase [Petralouisia muris]|uniref:HAMP domain-containing histidine kinase n=1 Tax=Petralouisia muris TaxID=3032872 RepID=A0AC61RQL2_9FIRM|nr:sensor histidine kinase [Petralouisia muris]TGY91081.1 HAMP domain-containing histidine kinase [Petralouisia muris]